MFVVCHETAEQAKRTRAEKEGKMREQIEQLKSDLETLKAAQIVMRKHGGYVSELVIETGIRIQDQINELERQADDPWKEARQLIRYWGRDDLMLDNNGRLLQQVALYVRHLELEVKQLESTAIPAEVFQRAALQRRIKHQRRELRMLNRGMHRQALEIKSCEHINNDLHQNKGYLMAEIERLRNKLDDLECQNCGNQPKFCMCEVEQPEASNADQA
jgi:hypothetical protein